MVISVRLMILPFHIKTENLWRGQDCYGLLYLAYSFGIKTMLDSICESSFLCRCGMLSLVISCTLLKGIKHQLTPCALIVRKTFMYAVVLFAILLVDSFFFFFYFSWETSRACFSCLSQSFRLRLLFIIKQLHLNILVHLFYTKAMLAEGGKGTDSCINRYINKRQ